MISNYVINQLILDVIILLQLLTQYIASIITYKTI